VISNVSAGSHEVSLVFACDSGSLVSSGSHGISLGAILLGSS